MFVGFGLYLFWIGHLTVSFGGKGNLYAWLLVCCLCCLLGGFRLMDWFICVLVIALVELIYWFG